MNFKDLSEEQNKEYSDMLFQKLNSPEELKDWVMFFFGIDLPLGKVDIESNTSPVEAMWEIYETVMENRGDINTGYIMLSARECYKTLGASILEALLLLHKECTIAHMAAIQSQSAKAISYLNGFFAKIEPLLDFKGWSKISENKNKISYRTDSGEEVYIRVIIATMAGANSEHTLLMFIDEIDVVANPKAYEEAKLIPGYTKGTFPVTVKLSTRKFAFGLMQQEIDKANHATEPSGDKILRWNILDVTERCDESRHKPELPKADVFVGRSLPLKTISPEEYFSMPDVEQDKYLHLPQVHGGCVSCKLLAVCKTKLADRPLTAKGGLYKPISVVINTFKKTNPDMAEAQLMCWKPSSKGLVYPRFDPQAENGNVLSLEKAWETMIGEERKKVNFEDLLLMLQAAGIRFFAGVDWGFTHDFVIVIFAQIPNGEWWIVDCYSQSGLEFDDCMAIAKSYRDKYHPEKWWADTAMPAHIKSFNKNKMRCPKFTKDVMGGIEAVRSKIVDSTGKRHLKVLATDNCSKVISALQSHHFKLDSQQNPTLIPDDDPGTADQADAIRYVGQNMFPLRGEQKNQVVWSEEEKRLNVRAMTHEQQMKNEIATRVGGATQTTAHGSGKKGSFIWSI